MNSRKPILALVILCVVVLASAVLPETPTNPTRVSDSMVAPPPTSFTAIWVVTPTGKVLVQPDASIKIDLTATPPVIRAVLPPLPAAAQEQVDQWVASAGQASFTLSAAPATGTPVKVYKNGLLQWRSADYSQAGQTVTFLPAQGTAAGDYIQALYWK